MSIIINKCKVYNYIAITIIQVSHVKSLMKFETKGHRQR